jgi:capsule biosynthesis phosphatase
MKRLIVDLDHTICVPDEGSDQSYDVSQKYKSAKPITAVVEKLKEYQQLGFSISIHTSRNMRTYNGDRDKIIEFTLPIILSWLDEHQVPFDEVIVAKPWCGLEGFYIDDRAIRPREFVSNTVAEIERLIERDKL